MAYDNPQIENLLLTLAKRLAVTNGKKQYGYLRYDIKEIIDSIVDEIGKDERIDALYGLWYEAKENALQVYSESLPERVPLSRNREFKSLKNLVIAEEMKLNLAEDDIQEPKPTDEDHEPAAEEMESVEMPQEDTVLQSRWQLYRMAKEQLDRDGSCYNPQKAVEYLYGSAKQGCTVAKYLLGKLFLKGEDVPKQINRAIYWLESAVQDGSQYAEYLLGKTYLKGEDVERDIEKAGSLLRRSAGNGNRYAAYTLGKAYLNGDIPVQDIDEAVRLLTLSADKGFAPAQFILGRLLYKGEVVSKDIRAALGYLDRAAAQSISVPLCIR